MLLGTDPIRTPQLKELMDTYGDEQYKTILINLPE
jgi:hypothetical protein